MTTDRGVRQCHPCDLLASLEEKRATILGHSLGGGIALQLAYQYPELCGRLVLVASGGLGPELHPILRAAALPGASVVLPWLSAVAARGIGTAIRTLGLLGFRGSIDLDETWRSFVGLNDPEARRAFLHTVRAAIDLHGQRICATDKLHLAADLPTMIVWGEQDPLIPVAHAYQAHQGIPRSRLEIFPGVGHYPHLEDPERFAAILLDFVETTKPRPEGQPDRSRVRTRPMKRR